MYQEGCIMEKLNLPVAHTALVCIDLQNGIVGRELAPYAAGDIVQRNVRMANALRAAGGTVVWVRVDLNTLLSLPADLSRRPPGAPAAPPEASALVQELGVQPADVLVTKSQWGAFYGTGLEQQLRRRGIRTLVMGGIATNFGVESTARAAFDRGYELVFAEDGMTSLDGEMHTFAVQRVFPHMGRVRTVAQIEEALRG